MPRSKCSLGCGCGRHAPRSAETQAKMRSGRAALFERRRVDAAIQRIEDSAAVLAPDRLARLWRISTMYPAGKDHP